MFEVGWSEILVIAIVLIVVVGPKDLPRMLRAFGKATSRFRATAGEFRRQFDEALKEADLEDVKNLVDDARRLDPRVNIRKALDPVRTIGDEIRTSLKDSTTPKASASAKTSTDEMQPLPQEASVESLVAAAPLPSLPDTPPIVAAPVRKAAKPAGKATKAQSAKQASVATPAPKPVKAAKAAPAKAEAAKPVAAKPAKTAKTAPTKTVAPAKKATAKPASSKKADSKETEA